MSEPKGACPICRKPTVPAFRPFCSKRCADVDLGRWLSNDYVIPVPADENDEIPADPAGQDPKRDL